MAWVKSENLSHGLIIGFMGAERMVILVSGIVSGTLNVGVGHSCGVAVSMEGLPTIAWS